MLDRIGRVEFVAYTIYAAAIAAGRAFARIFTTPGAEVAAGASATIAAYAAIQRIGLVTAFRAIAGTVAEKAVLPALSTG